MRNIRDSQKGKVYGAENNFTLKAGLKRRTLRELNKKSGQILHGSTFNKYSSSRYPVIVRHPLGNNAKCSWVEDNTKIVVINKQHMEYITLSHEMAHILCMRTFKPSIADHGIEFMWIYRGIAEEVLTKANFLIWEKSFLKLGVKWSSESVRF